MAHPGICGFLNHPDYNREDKPFTESSKGKQWKEKYGLPKLIIGVKSLDGTPYEIFEEKLDKCVKYRRSSSKRLRTCKCDTHHLSVLRTNYNAHHPSLIPYRIVCGEEERLITALLDTGALQGNYVNTHLMEWLVLNGVKAEE